MSESENAPAAGDDTGTIANPLISSAESSAISDANNDCKSPLNFHQVKPILNCVEALPGGALKAHFGYDNLKSSNVHVSIGFTNRFFPSPTNRGQPTTFLPGTHNEVFDATFTGPVLIWVLDGQIAYADAYSKRCFVPPPKCPTSCDDKNPCTADLCDATTKFKCVHKAVSNGTSCEDANQCNGVETCQNGSCKAGTPLKCNDNNPCTTDTCVATKGCVYTVDKDGTSCPVDQSCGLGKCSLGKCQATTCEDNNPCTKDVCGSNKKCTHTPIAKGTSCSDGDVCDGSETCNGSGVCSPGTTLSCDDKNPCTVDSCDATSGCGHVAGNDGADCKDPTGAAGKCNAGACEVGVVCNDNNPCTTDTSNPDGTCTFTPVADGSGCSDDNACNGAETCKAGVCQPGTPVVCAAPDQCHSQGVCSPTTGTCSTPTLPDNTACSDGNACTQGDVCKAGVCTAGTPVVCKASDSCHVAGSCDSMTGQCSSPVAGDGTSCSDGNACNGSETCQAGVCTPGMPLTCQSTNPCQAAACDMTMGCVTTNVGDGTVCAPATQCGPASTCQMGVCTVSGTGASCDDMNPCTADSCGADGTCVHSPLTGTSCSDGNACNGAETCQAGACTPGTPVVCTASDQCHDVGTCDPSSGTCSNPTSADGKSCDDSNACTTGDVCTSGSCSGTQKTCAASDQCHGAGTCDPTTGACSNPVTAGTTCDDGDACTTNDTCSATGTCGGSPKCTAPDTCSEPAGTCVNTACSSCEVTGTENGSCFNTIADGASVPGCDGYTGAQQTACQALIDCVRTGNGSGHTCGNGDDATPCLCGTLTAAQCSQADPTTLPGVCRAQYLAAEPTGGNIFQDFFSTSSPVGIVNNLFTCDVDVPCPCGQ